MTTNCSSGPAGRSEGWEMMLHADGNSLLYDCTAVFLRNTPTQDRPPQPPTRPSEAEGGRSGEKCCVNPNTVSQRKRSPWKFKGDSGVFKETQLQAHTSTLQLNLPCKPQTNVSSCYWTEMTLFIFTSTDAPWMSLTACEAFLAETRQLVWW